MAERADVGQERAEAAWPSYDAIEAAWESDQSWEEVGCESCEMFYRMGARRGWHTARDDREALRTALAKERQAAERVQMLREAAELTVEHFTRNQVSGNFQGDDEHECWAALYAALVALEPAPAVGERDVLPHPCACSGRGHSITGCPALTVDRLCAYCATYHQLPVTH